MKKLILAVVVALIPVFMGADGCDSTASKQAREKAENVDSLMGKQSTPKLDYSADRYLLTERLVRFNDPNKMTYLYVILPDGNWLQVTIIGKLASTSKRLTPKDGYLLYTRDNGAVYGEAPDEMGVWGSSDPAKVGMTTLGSLIEVGGFVAYLYSEVPLGFKGMSKPIVQMTVEVTPEEREVFLKKLQERK